jgi:c-di-GMP-binding flagellar brake protein YcgR
MQRPSDALTVGARLELRVDEDWLPTRLEDQSAEGQLTVAWPTDHERYLARVKPGQTVEVMVAARQDALYSARATVDATDAGSVPMLKLTPRGDWERLQRRSAVRASVAVRPRIAQSVYGEARRPLRLGVTNISATGVQVRSQDELRRRDLLELAFELDGEIEARARVRRVYRNERVWSAGCEFVDMSEKLARRIVQFIFAQQRALLRARRGEA